MLQIYLFLINVILEHLDFIYRAVLNKKVLNVNYQSFNARTPSTLVFHPYLLKEYNNRWFMNGRKTHNESILTLALDRIIDISKNDTIPFIESPNFSAQDYYKDIVGVTVNNARPRNINIWIDRDNAPYVLTKPLHSSQKLIKNEKQGIVIQICVIPNFELERLILGFGESMQVLAPESLRKRIMYKHTKAFGNYDSPNQQEN